MGPLGTWAAMPLSCGHIMPDPLTIPPFISSSSSPHLTLCWALCFHTLFGGQLFC